MKLFIGAVLLLLSTQAFARLTETELIGQYELEAKVLTKKVNFNIFVNSESEIEVQRIYPDREGQICAGDYKLVDSSEMVNDLTVSIQQLKAEFTCPDEPNKVSDITVTFQGTRLSDLQKGTNVKMNSSLANGMTLHGKLKKVK